MHWKELQIADIPELLELAQKKSWWDTVDGLAIIGDILKGRHEHMMQHWFMKICGYAVSPRSIN